MAEKRYGYTAQSQRGDHNYIYRPLVDVRLSSDSKSRTFKALVDSGTEITVMDQSIAALLDISSAEREHGILSGLESWKEGFIAPVSLEFEGFDEVFNFRVLFIEDLHRNFEIILGQQDFFNTFIVRFEKHRDLFFLDRAPTEDEGK